MWVQYYDISEELPKQLTTTSGINILVLIFVFIGIGIIISGIIQKINPKIIILKSRNGNNNPIDIIALGILWTVFMLCLLIGLYHSSRKNYTDITTVIREKKYHKIEGKVTNFIAMNGHSQKKESFNVKKIYFSYNYNMASSGYNTPKYKGGVIDANKLVRIHYYEGEILRLWVWEESKK